MIDYHSGMRSGFIVFHLISGLMPLLWLILSIIALVMLKKRALGETATVLWAILISILPILGAIAFWIVSPQGHEQDGVG